MRIHVEQTLPITCLETFFSNSPIYEVGFAGVLLKYFTSLTRILATLMFSTKVID